MKLLVTNPPGRYECLDPAKPFIYEGKRSGVTLTETRRLVTLKARRK